MIRHYHGMILVETAPGWKPTYSATWVTPDGSQFHHFDRDLLAAIDHFEVTLKCGHIKMEHTPLGIRVYTEHSEEELADAGYDTLPGAAEDRRTSEADALTRNQLGRIATTTVIRILENRFPWLADPTRSIDGALSRLRDLYIELKESLND